jgi:uracil-DNA glycosylase family protein
MPRKKEQRTAEPYVPSNANLEKLRAASKLCHGCDLYKHATQTVFGEGPKTARIVLIGEQPGDSEDRSGHPFTGPAGRLLDKAFEAAGIDREQVYLTNAVKHFGFQERGKSRLHKTPRVIEVNACFPWLEKELEELKPDVIVCLGATATRAVLGPGVKVLENRGKFLESPWAPHVMVTVHPSSILRAPDHEAREFAMKAFVKDLKQIVKFAA